MFKNLRDYIDKLDGAGELHRIAAPVDPVLEIAEITDRVSKSPGGGKALLFENTGTDFPVLTNMFGSDRRIAMALGVAELDEIGDRIDALITQVMSAKNGFGDKLRMLPLLAEMSRWFPRTAKGRGECQQVVHTGDAVDLAILPILKCWPRDGGRFVTLPLVNTVDPESGTRNVGMYRMQITGKNTTGMHWHIHKTGERHYRGYKKMGKRMPVSVCLGGDPVYTYAATAPMPDNMDEYLLAGFLRKKPVRLVKCLTNDIYVPSDCDFVIEGYVDPAQEKFMEGPFGDHTGFYSLEDMYPYFHVTAITHRRDAVYPATLVGIPPQEDLYIAKATEKIFLAPIRLALQPEIKDLYMPAAGTAHNLALVSIEKNYPGQAFKTASALWGAGQMMFNKILLVAGADTDLRSADQISDRLRGLELNRDIMISGGVSDVLDHAMAKMGQGGKIVFDLTESNNLRHETFTQKEMEGMEKLAEKFNNIVSTDNTYFDRWNTLIIRVDSSGQNKGEEIDIFEEIIGCPELVRVKYIVAVDSQTESLTEQELLWWVCASIDPQRDISFKDNKMLIDARIKTGERKDYPSRWPNPVTSDRETVELVDKKWPTYGLGEAIPSPSLKIDKLKKGEEAEIYIKNV